MENLTFWALMPFYVQTPIYITVFFLFSLLGFFFTKNNNKINSSIFGNISMLVLLIMAIYGVNLAFVSVYESGVAGENYDKAIQLQTKHYLRVTFTLVFTWLIKNYLTKDIKWLNNKRLS
jgi:hypothetical protein